MEDSGGIQTELDRRVYHLRTLYDVSKELFVNIDSEAILRNFLMMTTGNFGVIDGFVLTQDVSTKTITQFVSVGFGDTDPSSLSEGGGRLLLDWNRKDTVLDRHRLEGFGILPRSVVCVLPFSVEESSLGLLGLGSKIVGEPYNQDDKELLVTLVNNLMVALKNAKSFEDIKRLNLELHEKNERLQAAVRKIQLLEDIKANLCKFVPATVTKLIETSPTGDVLEAKERDLTVLFLDIEGYTKITERLGGSAVNRLVEKYFSVFMESIYENNGDVTETSGDGLMVLYLTEDEKINALEAVRTAMTIREKVAVINQEDRILSEPLVINMGICSGEAYVGATKMESYTGSRWTYSSHGTITNLAARICGHARGGEILTSRSTADRVRPHFSAESLGMFSLKNISEQVEIYELRS